jgi:hypothetical protein
MLVTPPIKYFIDSPLHRHSYLWVTLGLLGCDVVSLFPSILAEHSAFLLDPSSHKYKGLITHQVKNTKTSIYVR